MDIEISPTDVMRCASVIESAAAHLGGGAPPAGGGNAGFGFDAAVGRFAAQMERTALTATERISATAADLDASATLLRRVDDDAQAAAGALWSRLR